MSYYAEKNAISCYKVEYAGIRPYNMLMISKKVNDH